MSVGFGLEKSIYTALNPVFNLFLRNKERIIYFNE